MLSVLHIFYTLLIFISAAAAQLFLWIIILQPVVQTTHKTGLVPCYSYFK